MSETFDTDFSTDPAPAPVPAPDPGPSPTDNSIDDFKDIPIAAAGAMTLNDLTQSAKFLDRRDPRDGEVAAVASELNQMLGRQPGDGVDPSRDLSIHTPPNERQRWVPHGAMHSERIKRQEAEARAKEYEEKIAKLDGRVQAINEVIRAAAESAAAPYLPPDQQPQPQHDPNAFVDPETDLFAATRQIQAHLARQQQAQQAQQLNNAYQQDIQQTLSTKPDLKAAYDHLANSRMAELESMGLDETGRRAQVLAEERDLVQRALASGRSPSALLYELATKRGYRPGAAPQPMPSNPAGDEHIRQLQRGQAASTSLTGVGSSPGGNLSIDQIVNMSDDQFADLARSLGGLNSEKFIRTFGGSR